MKFLLLGAWLCCIFLKCVSTLSAGFWQAIKLHVHQLDPSRACLYTFLGYTRPGVGLKQPLMQG